MITIHDLAPASPANAPTRRFSLKEICALVERRFGLQPGEIHTRSRAQRIARPRQVVFYLARRFTPLSLPDIGRRMSRDDYPFDHTTVLYGVAKIEERRAANPKLDAELRAIERILRNASSERVVLRAKLSDLVGDEP